MCAWNLGIWIWNSILNVPSNKTIITPLVFISVPVQKTGILKWQCPQKVPICPNMRFVWLLISIIYFHLFALWYIFLVPLVFSKYTFIFQIQFSFLHFKSFNRVCHYAATMLAVMCQYVILCRYFPISVCLGISHCDNLLCNKDVTTSVN